MTEKEFKAAESILHFIIKGMSYNLQAYDPKEDYRLDTLFAKGLTYKDDNYCSEVYVNTRPLTAWQLKNFKQRANKAIPDKWYIEELPHLNTVKVGFK